MDLIFELADPDYIYPGHYFSPLCWIYIQARLICPLIIYINHSLIYTSQLDNTIIR